MQKKLYFLNEEEKNRILNLHESRTKKQYLNEQTYGGVSQAAVDAILAVSKKNGLKGSMLAPLQQREIDKQFGAGTFDKFYKNGGEKLLQGQGSTSSLWSDRKNRAQTIESKCTQKDVFVETDTFKNLHKWITGQGTGASRGRWEDLPKKLEPIKNVEEYCQIKSSLNKGSDKYKPVEGIFRSGIANYIYKNVFYPSSWEKYFEEPLKNVLKSAGFKTIDSGSNIEMADKKQEDKKIVEKPKSGKVVVLRKTYSDQIKNTLSLDPTTTLSDSDIKMIYDKLVQKGMIK